MTTNELTKQMFNNQKLRSEITTKSHQWFFAMYFSAYITHGIADIHKELFALSEDEDLSLAVVMAFRGSAKSTIMTMSYPIWAVLGVQQKKFVLIASQTTYQAGVHLKNIKRELESNELLTNDLGPFVEQREEWGSTSLFIPKFNARIAAISTEQSVRGIRHGAHRPDLIIADDVEDISSVKTKEGRSKTFDWYTSEIIPAGDTGTKKIVVGNLLHEDSLLMRLKERIERDELDGKFVQCPIMTDGKSNWPDKYPDQQALKKLERSVANRIAWEREYMLHLVPDDEQIITHKMIHHYKRVPDPVRDQYSRVIVGVDLAISEHDKADFTAILAIDVIGSGENMRMYVRPNPVNKRLSFSATIDQLKQLSTSEDQPKLYVEQVGYQAAVVQVLMADGLDVTGSVPKAEKRARLNMIADKINRGIILFPERGVDELITQLVGFGVEKHDDLVDALTLAVLEHNNEQSNVGTIRFGKRSDLFGPNYRI